MSDNLSLTPCPERQDFHSQRFPGEPTLDRPHAICQHESPCKHHAPLRLRKTRTYDSTGPDKRGNINVRKARTMKVILLCVTAATAMIAAVGTASGAERILIVHDELPQMKFLSELLTKRCGYEVAVSTQSEMPGQLSSFKAVIVFIHGRMSEEPEKAFIAYTKAGGKLIVLHHSISSGKRSNKYWFDFLGIKLPQGSWQEGGYKWIEPVAQKIVNINPGHYITSHDVGYRGKVAFQTSKVKSGEYPFFTLKENSEVYLNHTFIDENMKTLLLGFIYDGNEIGGKKIMQHTSGWLKPVEKGWLIYLQPGHSLDDMRTEPFQQILINAIQWSPERN